MLYIKALHIIFVVTWFAGLFYIVRLFIYFREANEKTEPERSILKKQFLLMQSRLWYGITWPSMILTFIFGFWMLISLDWWGLPFMQLKLAFVAGLAVYHLYCHQLYLQCKKDDIKFSSNQLRVWNEVATIFLVAIVFIIVLKNTVDFMWGLLGLVLFAVLIMLAIKVYKNIRTKSEQGEV